MQVHLTDGSKEEMGGQKQDELGESRQENRGLKFPSDSDWLRMPALALKLAMSPEHIDLEATLLHRHVLFSTREVLANHPLQAGSNLSK